MDLGFTDIRLIVANLIDWLKEFFQAIEDMFSGIKYEYAGYDKDVE